MTDSGRVVVAGAGLAGFRTVDELRARGFAGPVTLVGAEPRAAGAIAEGALMRLRAGARCFERYRRELWRLQPAEGAERIGLAVDEARADVVAVS